MPHLLAIALGYLIPNAFVHLNHYYERVQDDDHNFTIQADDAILDRACEHDDICTPTILSYTDFSASVFLSYFASRFEPTPATSDLAHCLRHSFRCLRWRHRVPKVCGGTCHQSPTYHRSGVVSIQKLGLDSKPHHIFTVYGSFILLGIGWYYEVSTLEPVIWIKGFNRLILTWRQRRILLAICVSPGKVTDTTIRINHEQTTSPNPFRHND